MHDIVFTMLSKVHDRLRTANTWINYRHADQRYNGGGLDVFDRDWDNLLLLDACRFDLFETMVQHEFADSLVPTPVTSRGACSPEFIRGNFANRELHDTVLITANSWYDRLRQNEDGFNLDLHYVEYVEPDTFNGATAHPFTVADKVRWAADEFPNKRLVVHFLQPHPPFFSRDGEELFYFGCHSPWHIKRNDVSPAEFVQAYLETLYCVLSVTLDLAADLNGKSVISADHGELFGERVSPIPIACYGHPWGCFTVEELMTVPWLDLPANDRKDVSADTPRRQSPTAGTSVEGQLSKLGYL